MVTGNGNDSNLVKEADATEAMHDTSRSACNLVHCMCAKLYPLLGL